MEEIAWTILGNERKYKMKIKRLDYKGKKWDKYRKKATEDTDYSVYELEDVEKYIKMDEPQILKYHSLKSLIYLSMFEKQYLLGNNEKCLEYMNKCLDEWVLTCQLWSEGYKANKAIEMDIERKMEIGVKGELAIALNREEEVDKVMNPDCIFRLLLDKDFDKAREISKNHEVFQNMIIALCNHDNISFENELEKRIKEIRKYPYDYFNSIDIWSVVLVKIAKREGMEFYHNYIEIPDFLL